MPRRLEPPRQLRDGVTDAGNADESVPMPCGVLLTSLRCSSEDVHETAAAPSWTHAR